MNFVAIARICRNVGYTVWDTTLETVSTTPTVQMVRPYSGTGIVETGITICWTKTCPLGLL